MTKELAKELMTRINPKVLKMGNIDRKMTHVLIPFNELKIYFKELYEKTYGKNFIGDDEGFWQFSFFIPFENRTDFCFGLECREKNDESVDWFDDATNYIKSALDNEYEDFCKHVLSMYKKWKKDIFEELKSKIIVENIISRGTSDNMIYVKMFPHFLMKLFPTLVSDEDFEDGKDVVFCFGTPHEDYPNYSFGIEFDEEFIPVNDFLECGMEEEYKEFCEYVQKVFDEKFVSNDCLTRNQLHKLISIATKNRITDSGAFEGFMFINLSKNEFEEIFSNYFHKNDICNTKDIVFCFTVPEHKYFEDNESYDFYVAFDNLLININHLFDNTVMGNALIKNHLSKVYLEWEKEKSNPTIELEKRIEQANKTIEELVDKVISLRMKLMNGQCIHPTYQYPMTPQEKEKNQEFCANQNCEACREEYTSSIRTSMLNTYRV